MAGVDPTDLHVLARGFLEACEEALNTIPTYENQAKAAWSEVLNQYKRRNDLIGNLVETVKGFAEQEKSVLTQVTEARARAASVQIPADIVNNPEAMKKYPDIKSGQNFLALQNQLEGTENRIAIARRDYIDKVRQYNTELVTFPGRIWKWVMYGNYKEMASFDIPADEQRAPKVDFGTKKP
jgi:LemA protein